MTENSIARFASIARAPFAVAALAGFAAAQSGDWVIPAGQVVLHRSGPNKVVVNSLHIEHGAVLRIVGKYPFHLVADSIDIDGLLDASGFHALDVSTLGTGNFAELGALGAAGGGRGGAANLETTTSTPAGQAGWGMYSGVVGGGGGGGESGYDTTASTDVDKRRAAGGGGGAFGPDYGSGGIGLVAEAGRDGGALATGALSGLMPPQGGAIGPRAFVDALSINDFFGLKSIVPGLPPLKGELGYPRPGSGGGAGGNACAGPVFPTPNWNPSIDKKGAGGGGGGGLVIAEARAIAFGPAGRVRANGGNGASGQNTVGLNHVGGASGGGSGGMILLQARSIDLSTATVGVLEARGGDGGVGKTTTPTSVGSGGNGGPGLVQVHAANPANVLVPSGYVSPDAGLQVLSVPSAHLMLPVNLL